MERWSIDWYLFTGEKLVVLRADGTALEALDQSLRVLWSAPLPAPAARVDFDGSGRRAVAGGVMVDLTTGAVLGPAPELGQDAIWREHWVLDRRPVDGPEVTDRWILYRLEPGSQVVWQKQAEYTGGLLADMSLDGRTLLISTDRSLSSARLYRDGELVHTFPSQGGRYQLTASGSQVYHMDFRGGITVYDPTGTELWSRKIEAVGEAYAREWPDHGGRTRFIVHKRRGDFTVFDEAGQVLFSGPGVPDSRFPDWLLSGPLGPSPKDLIDRNGRTVRHFSSPYVSFTPDGQWVYEHEPFAGIRAYRVETGLHNEEDHR